MLDKIIKSCQYVANNSKSVKINETNLEKFIGKIKKVETIEHWLAFSPYNLLDLPTETIINFLLVYEAIDFSFWGNPKWTINTENGKEDGSIALLYAILKYIKERNTTDFSNITKEEFKEILKGNIKIPLFEERYNIIRNVSKIVNEKMSGNFYIFIIREQKEKIKVDYSHLVGCSDYKIPQVMRGLGILEYSNKLSNIIDNKKEIEVNSEYEVEIRANMLVAIDLIKEKLENKVCAINVNDYIWSQGRNKTIELKPYHLTRNTNY